MASFSLYVIAILSLRVKSHSFTKARNMLMTQNVDLRDGCLGKYVKGGEMSKRGQKRVWKLKYEENIKKKMCSDGA